MSSLKRVAIVAGEDSGDVLGASLIRALKRHAPQCRFEGVGGARMMAEGFQSHVPLDRLAVMGLVEPLKRLPELLSIRAKLRRRYMADPPDIFIGIDAPDFNLALEAALKRHGVKTAHYVSPTVWAWRQGRVKKVARSIDLMLTLFPFEARFYESQNIAVEFVGHPLADTIPLDEQKHEARSELGLNPDARYVALLPGSRKSEVEKLGRVFLQAAVLCQQQDTTLQFLLPAANKARSEQIQRLLGEFPQLHVTLLEGRSHDVMASADVVLITSGTSTLEAMLLKKPMVIGYRVARLTYWILKRMVKSRFIGLPNLLADNALVPEYIQDEMTPENLATSVMAFLNSAQQSQAVKDTYLAIHRLLRKNASEKAAQALIDLWSQP